MTGLAFRSARSSCIIQKSATICGRIFKLPMCPVSRFLGKDCTISKRKSMDLHTRLSQIIPSSRVLTSYLHRIAYANDASYFRLVPQAVVQPDSIGEIQSLFKFTHQHRIPMTFRAAGTSLSGQAVTDGVLVDISKHWGNYSVEDDSKLIRFQTGIVGGFIKNVLR